ncbi:hypothetical protein MJO28_009121 [Puccinia striiformis f. sp. tritici]|uniref:Uncharacterized protein n=1 Tax=Puccinia striiformis f. sp. tritici TaxID=168172 RepID=A0ACC0E6M7_9BASI|nr:hypothetical protein MJO28_009121 [Puccinia striiformis f. sp. tritici]
MWVIRTDEQNQPANLLRDRVHSLSKEWLAGMRADFIEIQELMDINSQIAQDFNDWVEAGAVDSLVHQEKSLRESLEEIHSLESQAGRFTLPSSLSFFLASSAEMISQHPKQRLDRDLAISEMKKITDRLIDPGSLQAKPAKSSVN